MCLCTVLAVWGTAQAAEIEGAFGLRFGQVLAIAEGAAAEVADDGGLRLPHNPEHPYGPLTEYTVTVTPKDHRVFRIRAVGHFSSMRACRRELRKLEEVLKDKYVKTSGKISERFGDLPEVRFGESSRKIYAHCEGGILDKRLVLTYVDEALAGEVRAGSGSGAGSGDGPRDTSGL